MGQGAAAERPEANAEHPSYTTVYQAAGGWQSACIYWCGDHGGYEEPWATGRGPYRFKREAIQEAKDWAEEWGIEYRGGDDPDGPSEAPDLLQTLGKLGVVEIVQFDDPALDAIIADMMGCDPGAQPPAETVPTVEQLLENQQVSKGIQEALQGAARELEREHGYRVFVLDTIEVEPGSKPV